MVALAKTKDREELAEIFARALSSPSVNSIIARKLLRLYVGGLDELREFREFALD